MNMEQIWTVENFVLFSSDDLHSIIAPSFSVGFFYSTLQGNQPYCTTVSILRKVL